MEGEKSPSFFFLATRSSKLGAVSGLAGGRGRAAALEFGAISWEPFPPSAGLGSPSRGLCAFPLPLPAEWLSLSPGGDIGLGAESGDPLPVLQVSGGLSPGWS